MKTLLGIKQQMSQTFVEDTRVPVTVVKVGPCVVTQVKSKDKDGYWALQLGLGTKNPQKLSKPLQGHLKAVITEKQAPKFIKEVRFSQEPTYKVGDVIKVGEIFKTGDMVSVTGISKAKGFAGVVKRWHFAGGPKTHGQSDRLRAPGSIGQGTTPGRVLKGKHMAGRMGGETKTVANLIIVAVDEDKDTLLVSGPVPGNKNSLIQITKTASGKLKELIEETPQAQIHEGEEGEDSTETKSDVSEEAKKEENKNE